MSTENSTDEAQAPYEFDDLVRFITSKNHDLKCYVCTHGQWTVMLEEDLITLSLIENKSARSEVTFPAYCVVCDNCGNMHFHMARVVDNWLAENPAPEAAAETQNGQE